VTTFRDWFKKPRPLDSPIQPDEAQAVVDHLRTGTAAGVDQPAGHLPTDDDRGCSCGWIAPEGDQFPRNYVGHLLSDTDVDFTLPAGDPFRL
jgi:hypothetical protein